MLDSGTTPPDALITWQPVVDLHQRVLAYELASTADLPRLLALSQVSLARIYASRCMIIPLGLSRLEALTGSALVQPGLMLHVLPETADTLGPGCWEVLESLLAAGVRLTVEPLAWLELLPAHPLTDRVLARADWLILNAGGPEVSTTMLASLARQFAGRRWYVRHVATADAFESCRASELAGRSMLFHGNFLGRPRSPHTVQVDPGQTRVMHIMRLLRSNAELAEIDQQFKTDAVLLFKLMRFINSPINGLSRTIHSVGESLMLLGREPLFKWLSMLLYHTHRDDGYNIALLERTLVRARFMETIASVQLPARDREELFLTGMFSLLDRLLNLPLREAVAQLNLPDRVLEALANGQGTHAPWLELAVRMEHVTSERTTALIRQLGLEADNVASVWFDALLWTQNVLAEGGMQSDLKAL